MASKDKSKCSISLFVREIQMKTMMNHFLTPPKILTNRTVNEGQTITKLEDAEKLPPSYSDCGLVK